MNQICNSCGCVVPEGEVKCPACGAPTVHAPQPNDKKFWEEEPEAATPPPFIGSEPAHSPTPPPYEEPTQRSRHIEPQRKNAINKVTLIVAVVLVIGLIVVGYYAVKKTSAPAINYGEDIASLPVDSTQEPSITVQEITGEEADSIMRMHMAEMQRMEQMMEEMMASDPFEEFERMQEMMGGDFEAAPQPQPEAKQKLSNRDKIRLAGQVGSEQFVMVLNIKDQNNITGTAATVNGGKEQSHYRLLGIGSGRDLTVSVYDQKNNIVGT
ncbi:MAG: hypothetical protein Q4B68_06205, partial [Bacteroidales bacterium]|nr:hypothetical protein [Bacteroidales bacterium]